MSAATLVLSLVCSALVVSSLTVLGVVGQRSLLAEWHGSAAWTGGIAITLCAAVALGQALGAVGLIDRWSIVSASLVMAAGAVAARRRRGHRHGAPTDPQETMAATGVSPAVVAVVTFAILVVGALWVVRTVIAVRTGVVDPDTLGYHLPLTQAFARDGHADAQLLPVPEFGVYTYPANDELVSSLALAVSRSVVFTAVKNLVFVAAALVAAHAIGNRVRAGPAATVALAAILGTPVVAFTVAGTGKNDAIALLAVLVGASCVVLAAGRTFPLVLAAACGGVAVGTKLSSVMGGGAIVLWALVAAHRHGLERRWRRMLATLVAALATGAPWYLRNLLAFRNPLPLLALSVGPFRLPSISLPSARQSTTVAHFLFRGKDLDILVRGLKEGVGPVGLLVGLACLAGPVAGFLAGGWRRVLGIIGAALLLAYLATPASAFLGPGGHPSEYAVALNLHYALPATAICLLVLAVSVPPNYVAWGIAVLCVAVTLAGLHVGIKLSYWATHLGGAGFGALLVAAAIGGSATGLRQARLTLWRPLAVAALAVTAVGVVLVAASRPSQGSTDPVARYLSSAPPSRIVTDSAYPGMLYGPGGRNQVIMQVRVVDHIPSRFLTCRAWMAAVAARHARYVAVANGGQTHGWVATDPAFVRVVANPNVELFSVMGVPGTRCGAAGQQAP